MPRPGRHAGRTRNKGGRAKVRPSLLNKAVKFVIPKGQRRATESYLRELFGSAPRGATWVHLAERYPERFADYVEDAEG